MTRTSIRLVPIALVLLAIPPVLCVRGAPIIPARPALPAEARSLAGLSHVRVDVTPVIDAPDGRAFEAPSLRERLVVLLERSGLAVNDDDQAPRLVMKVMVARDGEVRDGLAIACVMAVHQQVWLERFDEHMVLPTASISTVELAPRARAGDALERALRTTVESLAAVIRRATAATTAQGARGPRSGPSGKASGPATPRSPDVVE